MRMQTILTFSGWFMVDYWIQYPFGALCMLITWKGRSTIYTLFLYISGWNIIHINRANGNMAHIIHIAQVSIWSYGLVWRHLPRTNKFLLNKLFNVRRWFGSLKSETADGLQENINRLDAYCKKWILNINLSKTKVIIFNKGGHKISKFKFHPHNNKIEIVQWYLLLPRYYLFLMWDLYQGNQSIACKAFFALKNIYTRNYAILSIKMFDISVMHVLTYAIEVWGPTSFDSRKLFVENSFKHVLEAAYIEKLNVELCKYVLGGSRKSCNDAVRGELGRYPVLLMTINQWFKYAKHCWVNIKL